MTEQLDLERLAGAPLARSRTGSPIAAATPDAALAALFEAVAAGVIVRDAAGRILFANGAAQRMLGSPARDAGAAPPQVTTYNEQDLEVANSELPSAISLRTGLPVHEAVLRIVRSGQPDCWVLANAVPILGLDGRPMQVVTTFVDITERKRVESELVRQALYDQLTGLPNRVLLTERLSHSLLARRRSTLSVGLLLVDLDRFKEVNDTFGHHVGDLLLQEIGARFRASLRETDTVARFGGDEFAALLPDLTEDGAAMSVARKLLRALRDPFELDGSVVSIQASIGIVVAPRDGTDVDTLIRRADIAMYSAKRASAGAKVFSVDQDSFSPSTLTLASDLRHSIERNELSLAFQPKRDMATGRCVGVEALARWHYGERGFIPPGEFIPLAEKTGFIRDLSMWVLRDALRRARHWQTIGIDAGVSVNISVHDLQSPDLIEIVTGTLELWRVPPGMLTMELTESAVMADPEHAISVLARIRELGVRLAIDDFGTGYSSLAYLQKLHVDELKIDRSFVADLSTTPANEAIVRSTIELAHNIGLAVVAEGIEDQATWDRLAELGCDVGQGYLVARPMSADAFRDWVRPPGSGSAAA